MPATTILNVHPDVPACGVKVFVPPASGVPEPVKTTGCTPKVVKVPFPEKVIPLTAAVLSVYAPTVVTFTCTVIVLPDVRGVPAVYVPATFATVHAPGPPLNV